MTICVLDFETVDPYISEGYGAGWPFAIRGYRNPEFRILGASLKVNGDFTFNDAIYISDLGELRDYISQFDTFVMHNAQYDIGCMLVLFGIKPEGVREFLEDKTFYDTMLMAKLLNQHNFQYNLEALSKKNGGAVKQKNKLTDYVWESGMYQTYYIEEQKSRGYSDKFLTLPPGNIYSDFVEDCEGNLVEVKKVKQKHSRPSEAVLSQFALTHLEDLPQEIVGEYCNADVEATYSLFANYEQQLLRFPKEFNWNKYSTLLKICVDMKARGVRVDVDRAIATKAELEGISDKLRKELYKIVGKEFNINAPKQVLEVMKDLGLSGFGRTATGNESVNKEWLVQQTHPVCKLIIKIKNYDKLSRDFLAKLIDYQNIHNNNGVNESRIFPTLNIFGATATGRFSSSGARPGKKSYELNIQQIPIRGEDDAAGRYVRACFIADEGEHWISADYSNQEQRLQVHFANYLGLETAKSFSRLLINDPYADFHQTVANFCNITRTAAKTINLGLSYGMGSAKLCRSLGLPTKLVHSRRQGKDIEVAGDEGATILDTYYSFLTFMKELQQYVNGTLKDYGYVKTIAGRKLNIDPPMKIENEWITFERKGLSKLVQGSGVDVTNEGMINAYNAGLRLLFMVHDELNIISKDVDRDKQLLIQCMDDDVRKSFNIDIPLAVEVSVGKSWAD